MFKDALKGALAGSQELQAKDQPAQAKVTSLVEGLAGSAWLRILQEHGPVSPQAKLGALIDLSHKLQRSLKSSGRGRESKALQRAHQDAVAKLDKAAWSKIKARFAELGLPDKSYRRLKQSKTEPHKLLARLSTRRAAELQGASDRRLKEWLA